MAEDTRRAVLEQAFAAQEKAAVEAPVEEAPVVETPPEPVKEKEKPLIERARDEAGRFTRKDEEAPVESKAPPDTKAPPAPEAAKPPVSAQPPLSAADTKQETKQETKPPASWRPTERESWSQVPKAARDAVERREREIEAAMRDSSQARQEWGRFREMLRPYEQVMAMNGSTDPVQSAGNLFRTAAVLQMGTPHQKAQMTAQVIAQFGVEPDLVAAYLSGQVPGGQPMQQQAPRDPRVDMLLARMEQARQQNQASKEARLEREVEKLAATAPYFEDVREQMASIIEVWNGQGKVSEDNLPEIIKKAYDVAVRMDDNIAEAERQRADAEKAKAAQAEVEKARAAASSIRGQPTIGGNGPAPKGRRETLERALDEQMKGRRRA